MIEQKTGTRHNRGSYLKDPRKPRKNETIGGGYFVFRRGTRTNRVRLSMWPFEYSNAFDADTEATRLAEKYPGTAFCVVTVLSTECSAKAKGGEAS